MPATEMQKCDEVAYTILVNRLTATNHCAFLREGLLLQNPSPSEPAAVQESGQRAPLRHSYGIDAGLGVKAMEIEDPTPLNHSVEIIVSVRHDLCNPCDHGYCDLRIYVLLNRPNGNVFRTGIDIAHNANLRTSPVGVGVIDTNGINPPDTVISRLS